MQDIKKVSEHTLWCELRKVAKVDLSTARVIVQEMLLRGINKKVIAEIHPSLRLDDLKEGSEKQATSEDLLTDRELKGCLSALWPFFVVFTPPLIILLGVIWLINQDSVSESLGKVAREVVSPVKREFEKFQKGYNEEKK